jgi:hypothetical protein
MSTAPIAITAEEVAKGLRFFADCAAKKWPLRGSPERVSFSYGESGVGLSGPGVLARSFLESVDDTGDAVFDEGDVEVDEQAQAFVGQLQIGQKLLFVHRRDALQGFDLHDHCILYHQVSVKSCEDVNCLVDHRNGLLASDAQSTLFQFVRQSRFVHRFQ